MSRFNNISKIDKTRGKEIKKINKKGYFLNFQKFFENRFGFLSKIYVSLNESGIKISFLVIFLIFSLYLFIFFLIGFNYFSKWYFQNLPSNNINETIASNDEYNILREGMLEISFKKINIEKFIYSLKINKEINSIINSEKILKDGLRDEEIKNIEIIIKKNFNIYISKFFNINSNDIFVDFSLIPKNKNEILESSDQKLNEDDLIKVINSKINSFYNNLITTFKDYLIKNYILDLINLSNPKLQNFIFSFVFGLIFVVLALFIFSIFIYKNIADMNVRNLRFELPNWIQIFTNSIQAGLSLEQSLEFSLDKIKKDPLKNIIKNVFVKYKTFRNLSSALEPFEKWKEKVPEIKLLVSTLKLYQEKGGNILPILYSLNKLIIKRDAYVQKIESITSEATGQLKIIFILFFGIILFSEKMFNNSKGFFSPFFSFCRNGGGFSGSLNVFIIHFFMFLLSYFLLLAGYGIIKREIKF